MAYDNALLSLQIAELDRLNAIQQFQAAGTALAIAIAAGAPLWVLLSLTIALLVAENNYQAKKAVRDVRQAQFDAAGENMEDALNEYMPYHTAIIAAMNAYFAAGCGS